MPYPIIEISGLKKSFKKVKALKGVDLQLEEGTFMAILGPNGAGKTTLVEIIEGLQKQDEGNLKVFGREWNSSNSRFLRSNIGLSLQETRFIEKLTVQETGYLFASFFGIERKRVMEMIELVDLMDKRKSLVVNLSGGQRQRMALALALLNNPKLLLLDEPTTGLDPNSRREIWNILLDIKEKHNASMILTTHYMEEAAVLCDQIIIMDQGKVIAKGNHDELLKHVEGGEIIEFSLKNGQISEKELMQNIQGIKKHKFLESNGMHQLHVDNIIQALPALLSLTNKKGLEFDKLLSRKLTLDDIFVALTGRRLNEDNQLKD